MELTENRLCVPVSVSGDRTAAYVVLELVGFSSQQQQQLAVSKRSSSDRRSSTDLCQKQQLKSSSSRLRTMVQRKSKASEWKKKVLASPIVTTSTRAISPTTFVQVDSSNFSKLVQELTGARTSETSSVDQFQQEEQGIPSSSLGSLEDRLESMLKVLAPGRKKRDDVSPKSPLLVDFGGYPPSSPSSSSSDWVGEGESLQLQGCPQLLPLFPVRPDNL